MRRTLPLYLLVLAAAGLLSGCGLFSFFFGDEDAPDPFAGGILNAIGQLAPANSPSQFLAGIAGQLGLEEEVARNVLLKQAVEEKEFSRKVEPYLISLFYKAGYSILPSVGEGHQFSRHSLVRGEVGAAKFLVTTRDPIRLIFVKPVGNVQIVYPKDGSQPQIFALDEKSVIAVRGSLLNEYLR